MSQGLLGKEEQAEERKSIIYRVEELPELRFLRPEGFT